MEPPARRNLQKNTWQANFVGAGVPYNVELPYPLSSWVYGLFYVFLTEYSESCGTTNANIDTRAHPGAQVTLCPWMSRESMYVSLFAGWAKSYSSVSHPLRGLFDKGYLNFMYLVRLRLG